MPTATGTAWAEHAHEALRGAGLRRGGARSAVVEALAGHDCAVTALELFEQLGLVRRIEMIRGTAAYERIEPDGHHHHHAICRECGRMETFEDRGLERAIERISGGISFDVSEHDVVLRGLCARCS